MAAAHVEVRLLAARDGAGRVTQPHQGPRDAPGEAVGQQHRREHGDDRSQQHGPLRAHDDRVHLGERRADARDPEGRRHRHLELVAAGGDAVAEVRPGAARERGPHLRPGRVVLQRAELVAREVGVGDDHALPVDDRQAPTRRRGERVHQGIEPGGVAAVRGVLEVTRFALQLRDGLGDQPLAQQPVGGDDDHAGGQGDDREVGEEEPAGEGHRRRAGGGPASRIR